MPDWTYHPLRPVLVGLLGRDRAHRTALHALATLCSTGAGRTGVRLMSYHPPVPEHLRARLGAVVRVEHAADAVRALPALGAGVVEVGPVGPGDVETVRRAAVGRTCTLAVRAVDDDVARACAPFADRVAIGPVPGHVHLDDPAPYAALDTLADRGSTVLATPALLVRSGPGWFQRVIEAGTPTRTPASLASAGRDPRRWPAWLWALLVGVGMVGAGLGAALITLGPLLLWYDLGYLGMDRTQLDELNGRLVPFLQHDRITMAGTMVAIGVLYAGLAWGGMRRGWAWARTALAVSGAVSFPTLLYFLVIGFVEPLHTAVTVVLFPMFLLAVLGRPAAPAWTPPPDVDEVLRRRSLVGQLLMVATGLGMLAGGIVISAVGLSDVFVPSDLVFLGVHADELRAASERLVPFVAHDRAGFGGALMGAALAVLLLSAWGWRAGERWVWWTLALSAAAGFLPAVVVHVRIGYTDVLHLAPVLVGIVLTAVALALARPHLCAAPDRAGVAVR
ncbi:hypothetical protein ACWFNE_07000 [Cellulomonas sp. NPDC055163]